MPILVAEQLKKLWKGLKDAEVLQNSGSRLGVRMEVLGWEFVKMRP